MGVDERRAARRREILDATRALFDARGVREAQIDDIARAVGINRAIIYRHFSGKEELFAVTLVGYLAELRDVLLSADAGGEPAERLAAIVDAFLTYGVDHPAFVDCAQTLLRRRGAELMEEVGEEVMIDLGRAMNGCLQPLVKILEAGVAAGEFSVPDAPLLANLLYTQGLGTLNLAHLEFSVREHAPGRPVADPVRVDALHTYLTAGALAMARGTGATRPTAV